MKYGRIIICIEARKIVETYMKDNTFYNAVHRMSLFSNNNNQLDQYWALIKEH